MSFEKWLDMKIDEELKKNTELKRIFDKYPERRELYKQKLIDSDASNDGLWLRYLEETQK